MKTNNRNHENLESDVPFEDLPRWFKNAKTKDAVVFFGNDYLSWRYGTWNSGTWENGTWKGGTWCRGTWKDGTWECGYWKGGLWRGGTWQDGIWEDGYWKDGTWQDGTWNDGTWEDGIWKDGTWKSGTWENGTWENGIWDSGLWKSGTWQDGFKLIGQCKWPVYYSKNIIKIGCKEKTIEEWDEWFESDKIYETERNTEAFRLIEKAYKMAKCSIKLEETNEY